MAREGGRDPLPDLPLVAGGPAIWDGRFEVRVHAAGWRVGAAAGRLAQLAASDRARLARLPPALRSAAPVLVRADEVRLPRAGEAVGLVPARFDAAVGGVVREADLRAAGKMPEARAPQRQPDS